MTRLREATRAGAGREARPAPMCLIRTCDERTIAGDVLCAAHDQLYRRCCPFCGSSMTDVSISRGACGICWQKKGGKEALRESL